MVDWLSLALNPNSYYSSLEAGLNSLYVPMHPSHCCNLWSDKQAGITTRPYGLAYRVQ